MDTKNKKFVYVIINFDQYTMEQVVLELIAEGFAFHFYFGNMNNYIHVEYMEKAEEVWLWGDCTMISDYIMAKENLCDIWVMG
jgi:hypothetical protein